MQLLALNMGDHQIMKRLLHSPDNDKTTEPGRRYRRNPISQRCSQVSTCGDGAGSSTGSEGSRSGGGHHADNVFSSSACSPTRPAGEGGSRRSYGPPGGSAGCPRAMATPGTCTMDVADEQSVSRAATPPSADCSTTKGGGGDLAGSSGAAASSHKNKPAELFRTDYVTAMKVTENDTWDPSVTVPIVDPWRHEWNRGVQVPVDAAATPKPRIDVRPESLVSHSEVYKGQVKCVPLFDWDAQDRVWVDLANQEREKLGCEPLARKSFEKMMEYFERTCNAAKGLAPGIEFEEDTQCDICLSPFCDDDNEIVFCDGCEISVHQACYGIQNVPAGPWLCRVCSVGLSRPSCVLCPNTGGAMKSTRSGQRWAHVSCALWIPEITFGDETLMEPITNIAKIPEKRWMLRCQLCKERVGACVQCCYRSCSAAFHVTCAQRNGLDIRYQESSDGSDEVKMLVGLSSLSRGGDAFHVTCAQRNGLDIRYQESSDGSDEVKMLVGLSSLSRGGDAFHVTCAQRNGLDIRYQESSDGSDEVKMLVGLSSLSRGGDAFHVTCAQRNGLDIRYQESSDGSDEVKMLVGLSSLSRGGDAFHVTCAQRNGLDIRYQESSDGSDEVKMLVGLSSLSRGGDAFHVTCAQRNGLDIRYQESSDGSDEVKMLVGLSSLSRGGDAFHVTCAQRNGLDIRYQESSDGSDEVKMLVGLSSLSRGGDAFHVTCAQRNGLDIRYQESSDGSDEVKMLVGLSSLSRGGDAFHVTCAQRNGLDIRYQESSDGSDEVKMLVGLSSLSRGGDAFHVTCAQRNGLDIRYQESSDGSDEVKMLSFCQKHGKKRFSPRKYKSLEEQETVRKQRLAEAQDFFFENVVPCKAAKELGYPSEMVETTYEYWKMKRKSNFNIALVKSSLSKDSAAGDGGVQEQMLLRRIQMLVYFRQNLEKARNLCYMIVRREKMKKHQLLACEEVVKAVKKSLPPSGTFSKRDVTSLQSLLPPLTTRISATHPSILPPPPDTTTNSLGEAPPPHLSRPPTASQSAPIPPSPAPVWPPLRGGAGFKGRSAPDAETPAVFSEPTTAGRNDERRPKRRSRGEARISATYKRKDRDDHRGRTKKKSGNPTASSTSSTSPPRKVANLTSTTTTGSGGRMNGIRRDFVGGARHPAPPHPPPPPSQQQSLLLNHGFATTKVPEPPIQLPPPDVVDQESQSSEASVRRKTIAAAEPPRRFAVARRSNWNIFDKVSSWKTPPRP